MLTHPVGRRVLPSGPSHRGGAFEADGHEAQADAEGERRSWRRTSSPVRLAVIVLAAMALVASCGGSKEEGTSTPGGSQASTTSGPPPPPPTYPLTGLPLDDPAKAGRPALVVKIDNDNKDARPQSGLNQADILYEEKVEGPISRFAAVFHSQDPTELGPVRSGRSTDVAIVSALNRPLYAFSGANGGFLALLRAAPLVDLGFDSHPNDYERKAGRKAPFNVYTSAAKLRALTPEGAGPPSPQLTYGPAGAAPAAGAVEVRSIDYDFGGGPVGQPVTFTWDPAKKGWARAQKGTPHVDAAGEQVAPPNVIVQLVAYRDTGYFDTSGTPVPEAVLVGEGEAWVFSDGKGVKATWSKADDGAITSFKTDKGEPVTVTPGPTWIALVPADGNFAATKPDGASVG